MPELTEKAWNVYINSDPCTIWKGPTADTYTLEMCGDRRENLTVKSLIEYLESYAD